MKKILLTAFLITSLSFVHQTRAQCSGASVSISNFTVIPAANTIVYSFTWQFEMGNASIQVLFYCNGVQVGAEACIERLKDSTAGPHNVSGTFNTTCSGTLRVEIRIFANPTCGGTSCVAAFREISNSPLPVTMQQFSATRERSNVSVKWETATEQNSAGFAIERNANGTWSQVGFVASQAVGGNSDAVLRYSFNDMNNIKGITQYRIRQVDIDGRVKYSETRTVRGEGTSVKTTVYPNPSNDGKVNVAFDESNLIRNISIIDLNGRTVRQINGVTNNNITIENLTPGIYTIRVVAPETGDQSVQKIIVNKR